MKVLFVANDDHHFGSAQALMELLQLFWKKHEITCIVFTQIYGNINIWCEQNGITSHVLPYKPCVFFDDTRGIRFIIRYAIRWLRNVIFNEIAYFKAKKLLDFSQIDFIHTNSSDLDFGAVLAQRVKVKHVCHIREFCDHGCFCYRKNRLKFLAEHSAAIVTISFALLEHCLLQGVEVSKVYQIYDGVDFSDILPRSEDNDNKMKCVMVGNISQGKGQHYVIRTLKSLPRNIIENISLDIIGSGSQQEEKRIKELIAQLGLVDCVKLRGVSNCIHTILSNYDVGIVASFSEGFGRVTVEFMAAGLLVIASDTGATKELIQHEKTGLLYPYGNWSKMGNMLIQASQEYELTSTMRQCASKFVKENFDADENADKIAQLYQDVLQNCAI